MNPIPDTENAPILRTDFSNPDAWDVVRAEIQRPVAPFGFIAYVDFIDDIQYADITKDQLLKLISPSYNHSFIIIVDRTAIENPEHPLLVIDLFDESHPEFRAIPSQVQAIENNLSIGNMDFEEFADAADDDGIFRGFRGG